MSGIEWERWLPSLRQQSFVRGLPQDLLSGKAVNRSKVRIILDKVRIILDEDTDVSGLYPMNESKEMKCQDSISFISEPTDLFYLQPEKMDWTTFERTAGFDLWHRRLGSYAQSIH